jgi:hypothetical protein
MGNRLAAVARPAGDRILDLGVILALVGGLVLPIVTARAQTGDPVLLNELLVSHTGVPDTSEFVELYGTPGYSLDGLSLVVVEADNGAAGTIELRFDFGPGHHLGGNGFFLLGSAAGLAATYGVTPDVALPSLTTGGEVFENGSQTVALVATATIGLLGTTVTGTETVVDSLGLWDAGGSDSFPWSPVIGPDDGFLPAGGRRVTDGVDTDSPTDWVFADDLLGPANTPTPGTPYDAEPTATCGPTLVTTFGTAASASVSATDPDGEVDTFSLEVTPDPGTVALGATTPSAGAGSPATSSVEVGAATPVGTYDVVVTALTTASPPQEATCAVSVEVQPADDPPPPDPPTDPSFDALAALFDQMVTDRWVHEDKAGQLRAHLERAASFAERGKDAAALAQLQAFANQVQGMSPKWVDPSAADQLAAAAAALAESLAE